VRVLEAARDLLEANLREISDHAMTCPFCGGFRSGEWGESRPTDATACDGYDHYPSCLWPNRQQIFTVLEAADEYVRELEGQGEQVDVLQRVRAYQKLVAALKDAPCPTS
jgi:hypothetical protein